MFRFKRLSGDILPKDITCFDIAKFAAVVLMVIDHVGLYVFPDQEWLRSLFPSSAPIWFFMLGYSSRIDIPKLWWIGGFALIAMSVVIGDSVFPVNILFTMMVLRFGLPTLMRFGVKSRINFWEVMGVMFLLAVPTMFVFEYGTQAVIMAVFGYVVKNRNELLGTPLFKGVDPNRRITQVMVFVILTFSFQQVFIFGPTVHEFIVIVLQTTLVVGGLSFVRPQTYPNFTARLPVFFSKFIQFVGRYTLEIYVLHLILLQAYGLYTGVHDLEFMNWRWVTPW